MYIYPNMDLYILRDIPLHNDYENTIWFANEASQRAFFNNGAVTGHPNHVKFHLNNQQYQRRERGWIQVNLNQNQLWDCNYLMFINNSFYNPSEDRPETNYKWFYAFILSVDYVNESVSRINYEIDVIQTWMFDFELEDCFVEREHSTTDNLFEHLVPENLECGDIYYTSQGYEGIDLNCSSLLIIATTNSNGDKMATGILREKYAKGLLYYAFDLSDSNQRALAANYIDTYRINGIEDNIIYMSQFPNFIFDELFTYNDQTPDVLPTPRLDADNKVILYASDLNDFSNTLGDMNDYPNAPANLDGYVPKNKKLFNFPYNMIVGSDLSGNTNIYKYELWDSDSNRGKFVAQGTIYGKPAVDIVPVNYRGYEKFPDADGPYDRDSGFTIQNFPCTAWSGDSYQIWLAQNGNKWATSLINGAISGIATVAISASMPGGITMASMISGGATILSSLTSAVGTAVDASHHPDQAHGNLGSGNEVLKMFTPYSNEFRLTRIVIKAEFAKIIDEYFSKFGYACHEIKKPNIHARTNWTYTKTIGCQIKSKITSQIISGTTVYTYKGVPVDDSVKIQKIFDNGITFWTNGYNVGNYTDYGADGEFYNPVLSS